MGVRVLIERFGDESPGAISASAEDGSSPRRYVTELPAGAIDIVDTIAWLVGSTDTNVSDTAPGRLKRHLPQFDPVQTTWAVRKVSAFKGTGGPSQGAARPPMLNSGTTIVDDRLVDYEQASVDVEFGPRPYMILSDDKIVQLSRHPTTGESWVWYLSNGTTLNMQSVYPEWWRYCVVNPPEAQNDYVTVPGQMKMWGVPNFGAGIVFLGAPRMWLPNSIISIDWYGIPARYVESPNSYIFNLRGLVNQYPLIECIGPGGQAASRFPSGSLLYLDYKATTYNTSSATLVPYNTFVNGPARLVNIKFMFLYTRRTADNPPTPKITVNNVEITNECWDRVKSGHNALPWMGGATADGLNMNGGRKFYYATMGSRDGAPSWNSAPMQLLWQDPDAPGAVQVPAVF